MTSVLNERDAYQKLTKQFDFYPFRIEVLSQQESRSGRLIDWVLQLEWQQITARFAVVYKNSATPKQVETAIMNARQFTTQGFNPMIMAPYFGEKDLRRLVEAGVSGLDFSGNGVVLLDGKWLVYKTGAPNLYPASADIKAIYDGTSSLVGRVFLLKCEFQLVQDIKKEIEARNGSISLGTVSKVLKGLEEDLVVNRNGTIKLMQPRLLLEKLREAYTSPRTLSKTPLKLDSNLLVSLCERAMDAGIEFAISGESQYTIFPGSDERMRVYTSERDLLMNELNLEENRRFPNIEIWETTDPRVFFDTRVQNGLTWTSPIQTYLDLTTQGKRERETAEQLASYIVNKK